MYIFNCGFFQSLQSFFHVFASRLIMPLAYPNQSVVVSDFRALMNFILNIVHSNLKFIIQTEREQGFMTGKGLEANFAACHCYCRHLLCLSFTCSCTLSNAWNATCTQVIVLAACRLLPECSLEQTQTCISVYAQLAPRGRPCFTCRNQTCPLPAFP